MLNGWLLLLLSVSSRRVTKLNDKRYGLELTFRALHGLSSKKNAPNHRRNSALRTQNNSFSKKQITAILDNLLGAGLCARIVLLFISDVLQLTIVHTLDHVVWASSWLQSSCYVNISGFIIITSKVCWAHVLKFCNLNKSPIVLLFFSERI